MPPLRTGLLSFGLVSIPVQLHTATKDQRIAFHLLHAKCGSRVQNRYYCPVCNVTVERDDRVRGYEFAQGRVRPVYRGRTGELRNRIQQQHRAEGIYPFVKDRSCNRILCQLLKMKNLRMI